MPAKLEERKTRMKLSAAAREVWAMIRDAYSSPAKAADRRRFDAIRRKTTLLPPNQRRYIKRLVTLHRDEFLRAGILSLSTEEFSALVNRCETLEELTALAGELGLAVDEYLEANPGA